jgi:hypothetical protein
VRNVIKWIAIGLTGVIGLALAVGLVLHVVSLSQIESGPVISESSLFTENQAGDQQVDLPVDLPVNNLEVVNVCIDCHKNHNGLGVGDGRLEELMAVYQSLQDINHPVDWVQVRPLVSDPS